MSEGHVTVDAVEEDCVLVGVIAQQVSEETAKEHLDELEFLALTAGAITKNRFLQKLPLPNPKTFVPNIVSIKHSQDPLNPVTPVMRTFLFL